MRPGRERPGCQLVMGSDGTGQRASMRPGRERPGCARSMCRWAKGLGSFNEAGARAPRMLAKAAVLGHLVCLASMRPGRERPGCSHLVNCFPERRKLPVFERWTNLRPGRFPRASTTLFTMTKSAGQSTKCAESSGSRLMFVAEPLEATRRDPHLLSRMASITVGIISQLHCVRCLQMSCRCFRRLPPCGPPARHRSAAHDPLLP